MATEEVGIRLSLQGRREAAAGLSATEKELEQVADAGKDVGDAGADAARGLEKATSKRFARGFAVIRSGAMGVARAVGRGIMRAARVGAYALVALGTAAAVAGVKAIGLAGDARETASAFDTVFGPAARGVDKDLQALSNRFGLYKPELQDAARAFGVFAKAANVPRKELAGFSTDLTKAGLDLASFYNVETGDALQALRSGLSGEAEPLRRFGIFLSDAAMKAEAANMGLTGELTEQQKVMVRHRLIMKGLGDAQGDLARTSGGFANQQRAATGRAKSLLTVLGGPLTTAATGAFRGLNSILKVALRELKSRMPGLEKDARGLSRTFEQFGKSTAKKLPGLLDSAADSVDKLQVAWAKLEGGGNGQQLATIKDNLVAMGPAFVALGKNAPGISDALSVMGTVTGFLADHTDKLAAAMPFLVAGFVALKVSQLGANVVLAASVPLKIFELMTNRALTKSNRELVASRSAATGAAVVQTGATGAQAGATVGATGAQRGLNAAMRANPIGAVITAILLLVGGFVLLYKKSDTFRGLVNGLWNNVLKPFGQWIGGVLIKGIALLATMFLKMGQFGVMAFRMLLTAAFKVFGGILAAAEKGLGWIPGLGGKISAAREAFTRFGDATIDKLRGVEAKLADTQRSVDNLARDREATITINRVVTGGRDQGYGVGGRAAGGPVQAGRPYIVGEQRPELFVPTQPGVILPRVPDLTMPDFDDLDLRVGPGSGGTVTVQLVLPDGKILAETVVDQLEDEEARM